MRVIVVDTNVFVSALRGPGASNRVIDACLRGDFAPLMGPALLTEYEAVTSRDELFTRSALSRKEREELLDIFFSICRWTRIYYGWGPNLPDEADNHLIELAIAGGAEVIVTRNKRHLLAGELRFPDLRVLTPEELLRSIA